MRNSPGNKFLHPGPIPGSLTKAILGRLFIIEGAVTAFMAIVGFFVLPNTPLTTWWLNQREKDLAHARMERDKLSDAFDTPSSALEGLKQACRDKRTWIFCLMQNFHLSACSFNSFFPTWVAPTQPEMNSVIIFVGNPRRKS